MDRARLRRHRRPVQRLHPRLTRPARITAISLPGIARDWTETRWDAHTDDTSLFRGDTLLYTDINPDNLLIGESHTWAVDWAWPTRGAAFIDPAQLVVQLIAAGHTPEAAENWATECTAWSAADPRAIDVFSTANARLWQTRASRPPDLAWLQAMADAARQWTDHRHHASSPMPTSKARSN